jgi:signal transduction histidine kinase
MARVLIVDGDAGVRAALKAFLDADGHAVAVAHDAEQARRGLREQPFDVLIADVELPGASGMDLLDGVRRDMPDLPVIMMTGRPTVETASAAVRTGAVDYLFKPISKNAILRSVNHAADVKALQDEARRLQRINREYQENLERTVSQRTREMEESNARLTEALEELKRAQHQIIQQERLSALGQMASGVAHDFNNALMPILAFSEILLENFRTMEPHDIDHQLRTIRTAAVDAGDIVSRLREFYRPRRQDEPLQPLDVAALVEQVVTLTRPKWHDEALARGAEIRVRREFGDVPRVEGNGPEMREALTNLVLNAADAMPQGGTLTFRARCEGGRVVLQVEDTGTGMSDDVRRRCMDPFFTTKAERGTGLGLASTYGIVTRHGGTIRVDSEAGKGTTITVVLPVKAERAPGRPAESRGGQVRGLRVLLVDDDARARESLASCLKADAHFVETAASGIEAFEKFRAAWFDLVITSRAIAGMSGDRLATAVKAAVPGKPVLLISGFEGEEPAAGGEKSADAVLPKPVTLEALRRAIRGVIRRPPAGT